MTIYSEGSGVANSIFGKSQAPIRAIIDKNIEDFEKTSMVDKIFFMDTSKNYAEKYTSETSLGDFEDVGENGAYPKTGMREGYAKVIEPTTWKSSFEVTQEMAEDAKMGKIRSRTGIFAQSYSRTREKFAADLLAGGTGSAVTIGGKAYDTTAADGKPLFATDHPSVTGKKLAQSNLFGSAFSVSAMDALQCQMQEFKDDDGNLLAVTPDTIILPNDPALIRAVLAAVNSEKDPESASNAVNFQVGLWNVLVWRYLPKTIGGKPYFMMMDSKFKENGMCMPFVDRVPLTVKSDVDANTDANVFKGRARFGAGFNNWRALAISGEGLTGASTLV